MRKTDDDGDQIMVWTEAYSPFIMGGDVHTPVGTYLRRGEPYDLGGGFVGYLFASPYSGETFVAEATTGAFVGPSIKQVRDDIAGADPYVMKEQIAAALERRKQVHVVSQEQFWRKFRAKTA